MLEERLQRWSKIITRYGFRKCIYVLCSSVWTLKRSAEQLSFKSIRRVASLKVLMLMNKIRADLKEKMQFGYFFVFRILFRRCRAAQEIKPMQWKKCQKQSALLTPTQYLKTLTLLLIPNMNFYYILIQKREVQITANIRGNHLTDVKIQNNT